MTHCCKQPQKIEERHGVADRGQFLWCEDGVIEYGEDDTEPDTVYDFESDYRSDCRVGFQDTQQTGAHDGDSPANPELRSIFLEFGDGYSSHQRGHRYS